MRQDPDGMQGEVVAEDGMPLNHFDYAEILVCADENLG